MKIKEGSVLYEADTNQLYEVVEVVGKYKYFILHYGIVLAPDCETNLILSKSELKKFGAEVIGGME